MKFLLSLLVSFFICLPVQANEPLFFEAIEDVPLMDGFSEIEETAMRFDKPEGRIVEVQAVAEKNDLKSVSDYYQEILPQFGWKIRGENVFLREDEKLVLNLKKDNEYMVLTVSLMPR